MNVLQRAVLPALNALLITTVLIYCMFLLIKSDTPDLLEPRVYRDLAWVSIPDDPEVKPITVIPPKPEEVDLPPQIVRTAQENNIDEKNLVNIPVEPIIFEPTQLDVYQSNQLTLVFAYPANYPTNKLNRGIEGFASIGFSVNPVGEVYDAFVIEAEPKGAFEKSALTAIKKFKYKPRYDDGIAVSTSGQSYLFRYEINDE